MSVNDSPYSAAALPADERERLEELYELRLLDTASELRFDRYTSLVADLFHLPIVLVSFLDSDREWFKSAHGFEQQQIQRDISFCAHAILQKDILIIPDTHKDPRFARNPLVTGAPHIRFYAGAVVRGPRGHALGTLCIVDYCPRSFTEREYHHLRQFADLLESEIRHSYDLEVLRAAIEFSAYYDPLTQLPNRRLLNDRLGKLIESAEKENRQVAVLLFNISELRLINQSLGANVGNQLLVQVGERLNACCPPGGTLARLQNGDFVLAFPCGPETEDADLIMQAVVAALDKSFFTSSGEQYVHVHIGGSVFPEDGGNPSTLIERASVAARLPHKGTYGGIRFFSHAESVTLSQRLTMESMLRRALEKEQLHLVYQPIVSLQQGTLSSMEALLRWHDPTLGDISPARFIPIAEQSSLIVPLGRWVQQQALEQVAQWRGEGDWGAPVAINVSAAELLQPTFARTLLDHLQAKNLPCELLYVEVTEYSVVSDSPAVMRNLMLLNEAGISISIDDFGTGYSSLGYLRRMPIENLKIDRSFVTGLPDDKHDVALTQTILSMAHLLGLGTVAEGVETEQQLDFLTRNNCRYVQGFAICHPVPPSQIPALNGQRLVQPH